MDREKTKFRLALPLPLLRGSRPKFVRDSSKTICSEFLKFHPNPFTYGGVIAKRVNIVQTRHKVQYSAELQLLRRERRKKKETTGQKYNDLPYSLGPPFKRCFKFNFQITFDFPHVRS